MQPVIETNPQSWQTFSDEARGVEEERAGGGESVSVIADGGGRGGEGKTEKGFLFG